MILAPEMEQLVDDLFYIGKKGPQEAGVLRAAILELQCSKCKAQDRWRGRSDNAVSKVARMLGWVFERRGALCPKHSGKKVRVPPVKVPRVGPYIRPTICTTRKCSDPVAGIVNPWGRPIVKCFKHYYAGQASKARSLAKKAKSITPTIPPCNVNPDTQLISKAVQSNVNSDTDTKDGTRTD